MAKLNSDSFDWLVRDGEMATRMRNMDWATSPLGPPQNWPQSLRAAINLVLSSGIPMYVWWGPENINVYNDAYIPIAGELRHPHLFGLPAQQMWPEIWPTMEDYLKRIYADGKAVYNEDRLFSLERHGYKEDCYFTFSFNPAFDDHGKVCGAVAIVQETTTKFLALKARDAALEEIKAARQELSDFFVQAPLPLVVLLGPDHRFALANPPYEQMVGRKVTGKTVYEAFTREEVEDFVNHLDEVYNTGIPYFGTELPLSIPDENGEIQTRYLDVSYHPFRECDGTIKGILASHQDVTGQVLARQKVELLAHDLQDAVKVRDEFLSIASHELKTPITSLKLQLQMTQRRIRPELKQVLPPEKLASVVDLSLRQTQRLTDLVEDLLDVSRIQAGRLSFNFQQVDVVELLEEVLDRFDDQLEEANCPISLEITADLKAVWDRSRVEQIFVNLISNALKYAPSHPIRVSAFANGDRAIISVQDFGAGIPAERQQKIFERFERASSRNISGLGLGLYIVKQIVEGHKGHIRVESQTGFGTKFIVDLPLRPEASQWRQVQ